MFVSQKLPILCILVSLQFGLLLYLGYRRINRSMYGLWSLINNSRDGDIPIFAVLAFAKPEMMVRDAFMSSTRFSTCLERIVRICIHCWRKILLFFVQFSELRQGKF